ncbi:MAG: GNAT family N-acetyltransferase [Gemmatirosa sp.]|nr:GNAT family N-acetyltransferase [Gemmatirosa sp.]
MEQTPANLPERLRTDRLTLRRWRVADAPALAAALEPSVAHLKPWIPWSVAEPAPAEALETRLAGYVADFDAGRTWLYGIFPPDESEVLGGIGLYPRVAAERVPYPDADRVEVGYWLRVDTTGRGYATEAARAIVDVALDVARALPAIGCIEIRCDPRNASSVAIPQRLGFHHAHTLHSPAATPDGAPRETMVWSRPLDPAPRG